MSIVSVTRWARVDDILLVCGTHGAPPPAEWEDFNLALKDTTAFGCLVLSLGTVELTSAQRNRSMQILRERGLRVTVVTDDGLMRRLVGVAAWFGSNVRAFSWDELPEAVEDLALWPDKIDRVLTAAAELRATVEQEFHRINAP